VTEEVEAQQPASSSMHQVLMLRAVHRERDGTLIVSPVVWPGLPLGTSYILNEQQLPTFERWYAEVYINAINRPLTLQERLWTGALFVVVGIALAVLFGVIDFSVAVVTAGPLFISVCLMKLKEVRTNYPKRMKTFPFPGAPKTKLRYRDWLKDTLVESAAKPLLMWIARTLLVVGGGLLLVFIATVAFGVVYGAFDFEQPFLVMLLLNFSAIAGIMLLPLPIVLTRRHFKNHSGYPLTTENLYLSKMGRLSGAS